MKDLGISRRTLSGLKKRELKSAVSEMTPYWRNAARLVIQALDGFRAASEGMVETPDREDGVRWIAWWGSLAERGWA